ncbi:MAG: PQQ-binding-like beta-propeller repeat protein [Acidobacteriota bacterium]
MDHTRVRAKRAPALLLFLSLSAPASVEEDWYQWRGPRRDGRSTESGLLDQWPEGGPPLLWKIRGLGKGYSSLAISEGRLFTMGTRGDREYISAYDATTGALLWTTPHGRLYRNNRGDGPRGTPSVVGRRLYGLGANGDLSCLEVDSGKIVWTMNVLKKFHARNISWGISESPLVVGNRLLVNAGGRNASIVALNKDDGSLLWKSQSDEAGYSSAVFAEIGGIPQAVFFTGMRALGLDIRNGRLLWDYPRVANRTANVATPIVRDNYVFLSSDYGTGCVLLRLKADSGGVSAREVYFSRKMRNHHATSVLVGDHVYGFSGSILTALRFEDGAVAWKNRSVGKGSLIYADRHLYCLSEKGVVGLVEATPELYREKGRFRITPSTSRPTWSHPAISGGRLYLRDQDTLYSFDIKAKNP